MEKEQKKLAILFPGIGYHTDKPLLYYAKELAVNKGYQIREVHYRGFPEKPTGTKEAMRHSFEMAFAQTKELLYNMYYDDLEDLLFISKSIGTAVACAYAEERTLTARHVFYTPLEETFREGRAEAIAFHGTRDQYAGTAAIRRACKQRGIPLHIIEGASHALETGDVIHDLAVLQDVMKKTDAFLA